MNANAIQCPKCTNPVGRLDVVPALAVVNCICDDGYITFSDTSIIEWDAQRSEHTPAIFMCLTCESEYNLVDGELVEVNDDQRNS